MNNIGRIITDDYCNGFADGESHLEGSVIVLENETQIVCIKLDKKFVLIDFSQHYNSKQSLIDEWCKF